MAIVVITGTNTDVGKTFATAQLTRQLLGEGKRVAVVKPAQTGEPVAGGTWLPFARSWRTIPR